MLRRALFLFSGKGKLPTPTSGKSQSPIPQFLAAHWHNAKNELLRPNELLSSSIRLVWWQCPKCADVFRKRVDIHVADRGKCPKCSYIPSNSNKRLSKAKANDLTHKRGQKLVYTDDVRPLQPMLAHPWEKYCNLFSDGEAMFVSPKLDGIRCIAGANSESRKPFLMSRKGNLLTSSPHIEEALAPLFKKDPSLVLDGELYHHDLKNNFEKLISAVRTHHCKFKDESTREIASRMQYHVFDVMYSNNLSPGDPFSKRYALCGKLLSSLKHNDIIVPVAHEVITDTVKIPMMCDAFIKQGYEGMMVRRGTSPYVHKRSSDLLKVKRMEDSEFQLLAILEGLGRLAGTAGSALMVTKNGIEFNASLGCDDQAKARLWRDRHKIVKDKLVATVQYQSLTEKGVPRFPVVKCIRGKLDGSDWL